jgi:hypothetical protein
MALNLVSSPNLTVDLSPFKIYYAGHESKTKLRKFLGLAYRRWPLTSTGLKGTLRGYFLLAIFD